MNKILVALAALMLLGIAFGAANAAISATMVEVRGEVYDNSTIRHVPDAIGCANVTGGGVNATCEMSWNAYNFAGFWYDLNKGLTSEMLSITDLSADSRTIPEDGLEYTTTKQIVQYKVNEANTNLTVESALNSKGNKVSAGSHYAKIGWQAEPYVALNGKAKKLVKLVIEQGKAAVEKKTLTTGEKWDVGKGWTLMAQSVDAKASPRQVWLVLSKDGVKKDDKIAYMNQVYTYVEKSIGGESDVPLFVTNIDSIFSGATADMVQLRYTWAVDTSVIEVKSGDKYGVMKVSEAGDTTLKLHNEDTSISLSKDATTDIMGEMKFKVADSDTVRFYPKVDYVLGVIPEVNVTPTPTPIPTITPTVTVTPTPPTPTPTPVTPVAYTPEVTPTPVKPKPTPTPGFEAVFAIAGLLTVAYLVLRRRT